MNKESNNLTPKQIELLKDLKTNYHTFEEKWKQTLRALQDFIEEKGRLPTKASNIGLYSWLMSQRNRFSNGTLPPEQIELLEKVGFELIGSGDEKKKDRWLEQFDNLKKFIQQNNEKTPSFYGEGGEKELYNWCQAQRQAEAGTGSGGRRKPLKDWQREKLNTINFNWRKRDSDAEIWQNNYEVVSKLSQSQIPIEVFINGEPNPLYHWVQTQKQNYRKGKLSAERQAKLEEIGIILERIR